MDNINNINENIDDSISESMSEENVIELQEPSVIENKPETEPAEEKKRKKPLIIINTHSKKRKKKKDKAFQEKAITERIESSPDLLQQSQASLPESLTETTQMLTPVSKYFSVGTSINIGRRKYQQDAIAMSNNDFDNPCTENRVFGILSDGMGGMRGGEKASEICISRMIEFYDEVDLSNFTLFIENCYDMIDMEIASLKDETGAPLGAGATMITFIANDDKLYWASVGDSHIYYINQSGITRLNREHNYMLRLREMVENGEISIEQANNSRQKEALISYMGMNGLELIDVGEVPINMETGDIVLVCSDGMYRGLSDEEILTTVRNGSKDIPLLANMLVNKTLDKQLKYQDNVSVIIAKKL